jgi:hypothetical protein
MGQVTHGSAPTTEVVRRAIQLRLECVRAAAKRYGVGPTTIQKWRDRQTMADAAAMGPEAQRSTTHCSQHPLAQPKWIVSDSCGQSIGKSQRFLGRIGIGSPLDPRLAARTGLGELAVERHPADPGAAGDLGDRNGP